MNDYKSVKNQLSAPAQRVLFAQEECLNMRLGYAVVDATCLQAAKDLKGDTRQIVAAMCLACSTGSRSPKNNWSCSPKDAAKEIHAKWWRTANGVLTDRNPALDAKQDQLTIYMEVDKKGYVFHIPYDAKATQIELCKILDPMIEQTGIWKTKIGPREKWGPTLLSTGYIRLDQGGTLESFGITPGWILFATHLKIKGKKRKTSTKKASSKSSKKPKI